MRSSEHQPVGVFIVLFWPIWSVQLQYYFWILSFLLTTQEAFVDIVDKDQTSQSMQSDPWSTLSTFSF